MRIALQSGQERYTEIIMATCTKCSVRERLDGQRWCRACFSAYEKQHRATARRRAFIRGAIAMQRALIEQFDQLGAREMTGYTAREIIRDCVAEELVSS